MTGTSYHRGPRSDFFERRRHFRDRSASSLPGGENGNRVTAMPRAMSGESIQSPRESTVATTASPTCKTAWPTE
jgi:hypothetical protein